MQHAWEAELPLPELRSRYTSRSVWACVTFVSRSAVECVALMCSAHLAPPWYVVLLQQPGL